MCQETEDSLARLCKRQGEHIKVLEGRQEDLLEAVKAVDATFKRVTGHARRDGSYCDKQNPCPACKTVLDLRAAIAQAGGK